MKPILVLCLGNEVLSDDSFGFHLYGRLAESCGEDSPAEVVYSSIAGFRLLDLLHDRSRVLVVDVIKSGKEPGYLHFFPAGNLTPSRQLINSHQISLPTALEFGRQMGIKLPDTIDVLAVEALDVETLSENMTPPVARAVDPACQRAWEWIVSTTKELKLDVTRKENEILI